MDKRKLDMSLGDPLYPFRSAARYAFAQAARDLNKYQFMAQGRSQPEVERTYHAISDYFTARGIKPPDYTGLSYSHFTMTGGGTTEAYNLVIQLLADDVREQNRKYQRGLKPVILMPIPTYGFFMRQPEREGIEVVTIERPLDGKGHITPELLKEALIKTYEKGQRVIAYYDSNPNNPLGIIRGEEETRALAQVFRDVKPYYKRDDERALEKWQESQEPYEYELLGQKFKGQRGQLWDGPASRIRIIDDIVYDGLEYGDKKPFAFAQIPQIYKDTFTLAGPSKAGLVNLRGGVVIGHDKDIYEIEKRRTEYNYFPARPTLAAMEAFYSPEEKFAQARTRHLARMNKEHRFRGLFMKALINGLSTLEEARADDKKKIISAYARIEKTTAKAARTALEKGIKNIKVITTPESGFFHLVDFSALRGGTYASSGKYGEKDKKFEGYYDILSVVSEEQQIGLASAGWMGMPGNTLLTRATFAAPLEDILEYTKRLRQVSRAVKPPAPHATHDDAKPCCTASNSSVVAAPTL